MTRRSFEIHTATIGPGDPENEPTRYLGQIAALQRPGRSTAAAVYPSDRRARSASLTPALHGNGFWNSGARWTLAPRRRCRRQLGDVRAPPGRTSSSAWSTRSCTGRSPSVRRPAAVAVARRLAGGGVSPPPRPRRPPSREYWVAAVPRDLEHGPERARRDHGHALRPGRRRSSRRSSTAATRRAGSTPLPQHAARLEQPEPDPRAAAARARRRPASVVHFKNLDTRFGDPHSMHFHGVHYKPSSDGAYLPGFSGRDADVKPGRPGPTG